MLRTAVLAVLLAGIARADAPKPPSSEEALVAHVAEAKWSAPTNPNIPPGLTSSPIAADPANGAPIGYAKFPAGYVFPLHWHTFNEYTSLISGKLDFTVDGKTHTLAPGSYIVIPAKARHKATCLAGSECILLTRRAGPVDYNFVKE
jgi:quercetin dioxygenase-like cupin family protein